MLVPIFITTLLLTLVTSATQLSDGTSIEYGTAAPGLQWQSSGILSSGCSSSIDISDCFTLSLTSNANKELDIRDPPFPTPRQRVEFRSLTEADGSTFKYTWKHYLHSGVSTSDHFFHLMQVFSTGNGGPVVTLDARSGTAAIQDYARSCSDTRCPAIPLSSFTDRVTHHTMTVTYGPNGKLHYVVSDAGSGDTLLSYSVTGAMGKSGSYVKFGTYREALAGMSSVKAYAGDFTYQQL